MLPLLGITGAYSLINGLSFVYNKLSVRQNRIFSLYKGQCEIKNVKITKPGIMYTLYKEKTVIDAPIYIHGKAGFTIPIGGGSHKEYKGKLFGYTFETQELLQFMLTDSKDLLISINNYGFFENDEMYQQFVSNYNCDPIKQYRENRLKDGKYPYVGYHNFKLHYNHAITEVWTLTKFYQNNEKLACFVMGNTSQQVFNNHVISRYCLLPGARTIFLIFIILMFLWFIDCY